ncbi:MAG: hypothetical protein ACOC4M_13580 [Promethearchaeia archaeon]
MERARIFPNNNLSKVEERALNYSDLKDGDSYSLMRDHYIRQYRMVLHPLDDSRAGDEFDYTF